MKYPLIYALSTVGILKHYNQDYLIHDQRTDFTGANGVGKSIIADLFQLIFVNDRHLFQFGTEGYKKDARQIHKLPHKCRDAYAFLTIEIEADKFICIGICIPNTTNRPLKPFLITADPDHQRPMTERAFGRQQLPVAAHFINESRQISVIEELSRRFRDSYGLYFEHYSNGEQKDEHYARLYDQQLLPINLSIPSSKKSFAKIVQSFSRARGGGDRSEELKDFLFDGVEKELEQTFDNHKSEIDKLLRDYDDLQNFIADLEAKQLQLEELNKLGDEQLAAQKKYLTGNCGFSLHANHKAKTAFESKIEEYDTMVKDAGVLTVQLPRLRALAKGYETLHAGCQTRLDVLADCEEKITAIKALDKRISDLTLEHLPNIVEIFDGKHLIDDYADWEIVKRCTAFIPLYEEYGSIAAIDAQIELQKQLIQDRKTILQDNIAYCRLVIQLFSGSGEDTLIARILQSAQSISRAQEAVLFHFLETRWGKPANEEFPYYADGFHFFSEEQISMDELSGGYWLRLDDLHILIPDLQHEPVLGDPSLRSKAITELAGQQAQRINKAETELLQLQAFEKGQVYDAKAAELLAVLDDRLYDYAIAADLALTAQLILQLDGKTEGLQRERSEFQATLSVVLKQAGIDPEADLETLKQMESLNLNCWSARAEDYRIRVAGDERAEKVMRETSLPVLKQQTEDRKTIADRTMVIYLEDRMALEKEHPELVTEELPEIREDELRVLKQQFEDASRFYQSFYLAACERFHETAGGNNLEIAAELAERRYNFPLLERILLGSKIRFRDQIAEELRTSNRSRHKLVQSIHETMLKIFIKTKTKYEEYRTQIRELNLFFKNKTISNKYFFQVEFLPSADIPIEWINQLQSQSQQLYRPGELPLGESVEVFVEDFFKAAADYKKKIAFRDLLDPRTYFTLDAGLSDEQGKEISGSTGETYSAKVLLGIGRLSKVQSQNRPGIRFIILEETANLDKTNFNNFPAIADEFGYQIITMTPKPFGADATAGWYLHHLLPGKQDPDVNYPVPASYFKTNTGKENLLSYLKRKNG
ncbi:MAG: hypothetical protein JWQ66_377 [Mucilaginibacter sp.]|nr:hypothetical protein [Mucilaginibacter sp.]